MEQVIDAFSFRSDSKDIFVNIQKTMEGHTFHQHCHILYDLRTLLGPDPKIYVEIGVYHGGSLALMLQHPNETIIHGIDCMWFNNQEEIIQDNIKKFNIHKRDVFIHKGYSYDDSILHNLIKSGLKIDILYIDGSNYGNVVIADFENYLMMMNEGGYIVFDDYHDCIHCPEVKGAVDEIVRRIHSNYYLGQFEVIGSIDNATDAEPTDFKKNNMFIIRKLPMRMNISFAIVTPTYKRRNGTSRKNLENMMTMLKQQSYQNFKLFLIGDGYEDPEEFKYISSLLPADKIYAHNLPEGWERTRCKIKKNIWSIGGAHAINVGLQEIRKQGYKYYVHLDDDDYWHPHHLFHLAEAYTLFPDAVFVSTMGRLDNWILPKISSSKLEYNNFIPKGRDCFHSTQSFRCDIIPFEYLTIHDGEEEREYPYADQDMLKRIGQLVIHQNLKTLVVPYITCIRDSEGSMLNS